MHPDIVHWGAFHVRSFGLFLAVAFLVGSWLARSTARARGLDENRRVNLVVIVLAAGLVGARLFYVGTHAAEFEGRWGAAFQLWEGGLTLYGGLAAAMLAGTTYIVRAGLPFGLTADALAPAVALGSGIARIGCFLNGCCYGRPAAGLPWAVHFPPGSPADREFSGLAVHPSQLYNAAAGFALFALLLFLRPRLQRPGQLWWLFVLLFTLVRLPIDATRYYESSAYVIHWNGGGLTDSALVGLGLASLALVFFVRAGRQDPAVVPLAPSRAPS